MVVYEWKKGNTNKHRQHAMTMIIGYTLFNVARLAEEESIQN